MIIEKGKRFNFGEYPRLDFTHSKKTIVMNNYMKTKETGEIKEILEGMRKGKK